MTTKPFASSSQSQADVVGSPHEDGSKFTSYEFTRADCSLRKVFSSLVLEGTNEGMCNIASLFSYEGMY